LRLKFFGTGAIGVAVGLIVLAAITMLFNGPGAPLAEEASVAAFVALSLGVIALFVALFVRDDEMRPHGHVIDDPLLDEAAAFDYSIIIPIRNRPQLLVELCRRIEELLPQWSECGRGEIVVIDDGSTDSTPAVAARLAETSPLPMRVVSQDNKGVSGARNRGFWEAHATIGLVIDSDCLPSPQWLPEMLAAVRSHPRSLVYAHVYSERRVQYPREASPGGAPFVGASFAMRVADYIRMGGNCEQFSGQSRDDGDLYLSARAAGYHAIVAERARVWHPIRTQTTSTIFKTGLQHRYDNLLAKRHGDRALFYLGDWLLGGSFAGHYPATLIMYAFIILVLYDACIALTSGTTMHVTGLFQIFVVIAFAWLIAQTFIARRLGIIRRQLWAYYIDTAAYTLGSAIGRLRGTVQYAFVLL
jgi:glycosyltransferase involved in cell wall biosynthesis